MVTRQVGIFLSLCVCVCIAAYAPDVNAAGGNEASVTVTSEGDAPIRDDDYASSRKAAIGAALVNAVDAVIDEILSPEERMLKADRVEALRREAPRYVVEFRILEEKADVGFYRVILSATVVSDRIHRILADSGQADHQRTGADGESESVVLNINGITSCAQYAAVKQLLFSDIPCIKHVSERVFERGKVEFDVWCDASREGRLAEELAAADLRGIHLVVRHSTPGRIDVDILSW